MSQGIAQAGQFIVTTARAIAPDVASAATDLAVATVTNAAITAGQNVLFGPVKQRREGPRREDIRLQTATEGVGIPRLYGRQRLAGQIIWITHFKETSTVTTTSSGGKGVRRSVQTETTTYEYTVSLAIGLCEGTISRIGRVWADGKPISLSDYNVRLHQGTADQLPDALIETVEGAGNAPAYRGLAYIVVEDLPLSAFGHRVPQFNFEVERPLAVTDPDALENAARAVTLIPGSGESVYHTEPVLVETAEGVTRAENVYTNAGGTDYQAALDHLTTTLPQVGAVELIVSWFGTDLRAGSCAIEPRVELKDKVTLPDDWSVAGLSRTEVNEVSRLPDGALAYGGTPSDAGVSQAIADLKARGQQVVFYPFVLMDIPADNTLPDPYGGAAQPAFPWRGRITCHPRATADKTAAARTQVDAFFAQYRPMILHYAQLCQAAGGVSGFLIGSELRELTNIRDEQNRFPAVEALISLTDEVRAILGPTAKISYAADWSEYANYRPDDGSGDVYFHLDPLWAHPEIDFVGIDHYMPLSDWRAGAAHADAATAPSIYDRDYLQANIAGGEGFDWFYATPADRDAQIRTPITDTAYGEDWVFRYKDLSAWWSLPHYDRPGGVKAVAPTAWTPGSKPFWFTELGCSATDKGPNQPNIFFDPKSAESGRPYYSQGARDDMIQRRFLEAHLHYWQDDSHNPDAVLFTGKMVDTDHIFLYTWDARPFPDFPVRQDVWADADNWIYGHWLNGRVGRVPLGALIEDIAARSGLPHVDASACQTLVTGYRLGGPLSARAGIEPLLTLYQLDAVEQGGVLVIRPRSGTSLATIPPTDLVDLAPQNQTQAQGPLTITRLQEADLPERLALTYTDGLSDYQTAVAEVQDPAAISARAMFLDTAIVLEAGEAEARAMALLAEARTMRTRAQFALPPADMALEPADVVTVTEGGRDLAVRLTRILDGDVRQVEGVRTDTALYQPRYTGLSGRMAAAPAVAGPVALAVMDLPLLPDGEDGAFLRIAAFAAPWPGQVALYRGAGADAALMGTLPNASLMGRLIDPLAAGPTGRWDRGSALRLTLPAGGLATLSARAVLDGAGRAAVEVTPGVWEVIGYQRASLGPDGVWTLSDLLRGLAGTEAETAQGAPADARIVFLGLGQHVAPLDPNLFGTQEVWQAGPAGQAPGVFPFREASVTLTGTGVRPLSPVHLRAVPNGANLDLSWIRRSRIGGDNWAATAIPLGEASESYQVISYDSAGTALDTQMVTTPAASVAAASVSRVEVAQISALFGPGRATQLLI